MISHVPGGSIDALTYDNHDHAKTLVSRIQTRMRQWLSIPCVDPHARSTLLELSLAAPGSVQSALLRQLSMATPTGVPSAIPPPRKGP